MPATVGMPWRRAAREQHGDHDEGADARLPSSHSLTSVLTRLFPCDPPPATECTHDRPGVTSPEDQEKRDRCPRWGRGDGDLRGSSMGARQDFKALMSIPAGVDLHQGPLKEGEDVHEP
jgi:hypothetical protein